MSYQVIITEEVAANVAVTTQNYPITIEYNATSIPSEGSYGNANVASYLAANTALPITTTANITAGYFVGNGSQLTGVVATSTYGNANVATYLPTYTGNVGANVVIANLFQGSGANLTNLTGANVTGTVANATYAITAGSATTAGTANSVAGANVSGTVASATLATYATTANAVAGANVSGTVANATYATTAGVASYVTANAQANITSVGTLTSLSVGGNVTAGNVAAVGVITGSGSVPTGGAADTYLVKNSATNYDYSWTDRVNAKTIYENVKNVSGGTLTKGTPVYQIGVTGNTITVGAARADDPAKLAIGVLDVTLADAAEGRMLVLGEIKGVDTSGFTTGDEIYLGATGGYTNVKPTSSSVAIQFLGVVNRVDASIGSGFITGTLTADSVKYATYPQVWTGSAWVPATELSSDTTPALGGDLATGAYNISGTGNVTAARVTTTSDVIIGGNLTVNGDTQYTNITSFSVEDPVIEMGRGANNTPLASDDGKDRGERLWYYAGSEKSAFAGYDNSAGKMILATDVSISSEVVTVNNFGNTQVGNLDAVNVVATNISGDGSGLSNITGGNVTGTVSSATSAATAAQVTDAAQANITSVGTLTSLSVSGNVSPGNIVVPNAGKYRGDFSSGATAGRTFFQTTNTGTTATTFISAIPGPNHVANANVNGAATGLFSSNDIGNASIFGMYSYPNDAQLRSLALGTGNVNNITFRFGASGVGTLAATITSTGDITAVGNITAGSGKFVVGDGSTLSNITGANVTGTVSSASTAAQVTDATQGNITAVGTLTSLSVTGTVTGGNLATGGTVSATGNITGGNVTTAGTVSTTGRVIAKNYTEGVYAIGTTSGTITPDINNGAIQTITLNGNLTFSSITNIQAGQSFTLIVTQDGTGSRLLTSTMKYAGASKTLTTTASAVDIISVFYDGTNYWASLTKGYA